MFFQLAALGLFIICGGIFHYINFMAPKEQQQQPLKPTTNKKKLDKQQQKFNSIVRQQIDHNGISYQIKQDDELLRAQNPKPKQKPMNQSAVMSQRQHYLLETPEIKRRVSLNKPKEVQSAVLFKQETIPIVQIRQSPPSQSSPNFFQAVLTEEEQYLQRNRIQRDVNKPLGFQEQKQKVFKDQLVERMRLIQSQPKTPDNPNESPLSKAFDSVASSERKEQVGDNKILNMFSGSKKLHNFDDFIEDPNRVEPQQQFPTFQRSTIEVQPIQVENAVETIPSPVDIRERKQSTTIVLQEPQEPKITLGMFSQPQQNPFSFTFTKTESQNLSLQAQPSQSDQNGGSSSLFGSLAPQIMGKTLSSEAAPSLGGLFGAAPTAKTQQQAEPIKSQGSLFGTTIQVQPGQAPSIPTGFLFNQVAVPVPAQSTVEKQVEKSGEKSPQIEKKPNEEGPKVASTKLLDDAEKAKTILEPTPVIVLSNKEESDHKQTGLQTGMTSPNFGNSQNSLFNSNQKPTNSLFSQNTGGSSLFGNLVLTPPKPQEASGEKQPLPAFGKAEANNSDKQDKKNDQEPNIKKTESSEKPKPQGEQPAPNMFSGFLSQKSQDSSTGGLFGQGNAPKSLGGLFSQVPPASTTQSLFGNPQPTASLFANLGQPAPSLQGIFGQPAQPSLFSGLSNNSLISSGTNSTTQEDKQQKLQQ